MEEVKEHWCGDVNDSIAMWIQQACADDVDDRLNAVDAEGWLRDLLGELPNDERRPTLTLVVEGNQESGQETYQWTMSSSSSSSSSTDAVDIEHDDGGDGGVDDPENDSGDNPNDVAIREGMKIDPTFDFLVCFETESFPSIVLINGPLVQTWILQHIIPVRGTKL